MRLNMRPGWTWVKYLKFGVCLTTYHCVKSVRIRNYSGPYFLAFGLNTEDTPHLSVFIPNAGKYESK